MLHTFCKELLPCNKEAIWATSEQIGRIGHVGTASLPNPCLHVRSFNLVVPTEGVICDWLHFLEHGLQFLLLVLVIVE